MTPHRKQDPAQDLMTLAVENGVECILDLSTGRQWHTLPRALRDMRRLPQRAVTSERLERVLQAAGIPSGLDEEGDLWAELYGDIVVVLVSEERRFVRFLRVVALQPGTDDERLHSLLNHLNNEYDVAKFRSYQEGLLSAEYAMSFEHGLSPQQMVAMLRGFAQTVQQAFQSEPVAALLRH